MPYRLLTYRNSAEIPSLPGSNLFHSTALFRVFEQTPGYDPYMIVVFNRYDVMACLLAVVRRSVRRFPPSIIKRCEVYGTGEYFGDVQREEVFGLMLGHLTDQVADKCFMVEFRNLDNALFGYKYFRENAYFPVNWLHIHNSLHSKDPEERLSASRKRQIRKGLENGATMHEAQTEEEVIALARLLKRNYSSKWHKHFPGIRFFLQLVRQDLDREIGHIFIIRYKGKIIGGSVCLYSDGDAYLWFSGGLSKSYARQYPGVLAVWKALRYAYEQGYHHMIYMDVGYTTKTHGYRDFLLRFGGKQSDTRRWFRFRWGWLNRLFTKLYI